jgi:uncharacterized protein (UPF0179 family)
MRPFVRSQGVVSHEVVDAPEYWLVRLRACKQSSLHIAPYLQEGSVIHLTSAACNYRQCDDVSMVMTCVVLL